MKKNLILLCILSFAAIAFLLHQHVFYKDRIYSASKRQFELLTVKSAKEIDSIVQQTMEAADSIAADLTTGKIAKNNLQETAKKILKKCPQLDGITFAFTPSDEQGKELYAPYWSKKYAEKKDSYTLEFNKVEDVYDYTTPEHEWYFKPISEKKNSWTEPYWAEAANSYLISYSALFYNKKSNNGKDEPAGVVTVDLSLKHIKKIIEAQQLGRNGFGGLTTGSGKYLYHPEQEYVVDGKSLQDIAQEKNDKDRLKVAEMAKLGQSGIIDHISTTTGEESWLMVQPVPSSGWSIQNTFMKNDIEINTNTLRHQAILLVISLAIFLVSFIFFVLLFVFPFKGNIWTSVVLFSLIMATGIGFVWRYALMYTEYEPSGYTVLSDKATLDSVVNRLMRIHQGHLQKSSISFIPTGLYIESLDFSSPKKLSVSGYVWQKYPEGFPDELKKFQIVPLMKLKTEHISTRKQQGTELIRTRFEADIPVHISYSKYPLEVEEICIQLLPVDSSNITFVPDFDSNMIDASIRFPGLIKNITLSGWELTHTFFDLENKKVSSNLGVTEDYDQEKLPALSYRIGIKRSFINAFISNLTPLIVVTIILFFVLIFPANVDLDKILGISTSLFFVVVFSHIGIRRTFAADELFYLEYFFFVLYGCIVTTPGRAFLVKYGYQGKLITYQDGIILKAAYWPTLLTVLFIITAWTFY